MDNNCETGTLEMSLTPIDSVKGTHENLFKITNFTSLSLAYSFFHPLIVKAMLSPVLF